MHIDPDLLAELERGTETDPVLQDEEAGPSRWKEREAAMEKWSLLPVKPRPKTGKQSSFSRASGGVSSLLVCMAHTGQHSHV